MKPPEKGRVSLVGDSSHWYVGMQPMVRAGIDGSVDPTLQRVIDALPENAKKEGHREIEVSYRLAKDELDHAMGVLEEQGAVRVLEGEYEQEWYDTSELCKKLNDSTTLAALSICNNMEIRVRSLKTKDGIEFHWAVKVRGLNGSIERIEHEGVASSWEDALTELNAKIAEVLNADVTNPDGFTPITRETKTTMKLKKSRISYRFEDRPDGEKLPCTGSQVDFDVWTEVTKDGQTIAGSIDEPVLITVDVEGPVLNGNAEGLTPEEAQRVPSVENCAWCLSFPQNTYDLFSTIDGLLRGQGK